MPNKNRFAEIREPVFVGHCCDVGRVGWPARSSLMRSGLNALISCSSTCSPAPIIFAAFIRTEVPFGPPRPFHIRHAMGISCLEKLRFPLFSLFWGKSNKGSRNIPHELIDAAHTKGIW